MHEMNKNMRVVRQQMESALRRELVRRTNFGFLLVVHFHFQLGIDTSYQADAFLDLDEKQKKSMLVNAKLKDEGRQYMHHT